MTTSMDAPEDRAEHGPINGGGRAQPAPVSASARSATGDSEHDPSASSSAAPTPLVAESISILDSAMEFLLARLNLEGYRLERRARGLVARAAAVAVAGLIAMLGFVLASVGGAMLLAKPLESLPAGFLIVGGAELLAGLIAALVLGRRSRRAGIARVSA